MRKCLISVLASVIIFILAIQATPALAIEIIYTGLKGLKELNIGVEEIKPGFAITAEDIKKEVFVILKAKAPKLKIVDFPWGADLYISVTLDHLSVVRGYLRGYYGNIYLSLDRTVFLPDGTEVFGASVWNKSVIFSGPSGEEGSQIRKILSELLTEFIYAYQKANP